MSLNSVRRVLDLFRRASHIERKRRASGGASHKVDQRRKWVESFSRQSDAKSA
jgi:Cdc6-like AAA superfamily ATPase